MRRTVWNTGGCSSWYLDDHGRNVDAVAADDVHVPPADRRASTATAYDVRTADPEHHRTGRKVTA